jgi:hypothetical protein
MSWGTLALAKVICFCAVELAGRTDELPFKDLGYRLFEPWAQRAVLSCAFDIQMLENGKAHFYMEFVEKAMRALATVSEVRKPTSSVWLGLIRKRDQVPWIMPLLSYLPAGKEQQDMYEFR